MNKCIIVGAGTYGQVYAKYLKSEYEILGFIDDNAQLKGTIISQLPVIGNLQFLLDEMDRKIKVFVPIGDTSSRERILREVRKNGFSTPNYIHSTVNIGTDVILGDSAIYILQGVVIMPMAVIDNDVMISSGTIISHHAVIQKNVFISFGVNVGASVLVREKSYVGIGATIMTGVKQTGYDCLIGAGAVVIRDVPDYATVVGNPAKVIKVKNNAHAL
ncbi:Sugar O-acyltransferase, sialic acid O-acetyltransferase NeuD family [Capnocytophaga canis]|uniref:Sugar O-acyltransferase, sialic acid O-acetyltransferase NeuD family n=1 Tax=Capnocytophaga canis TaxID=1848903 RepID=A0A0B7HUJ1_9FLAO|nr:MULTISPECIES: NeuD/PglB/VioB family sugar acetyltransferase [Capnocytophaga]ATA74773.1 sialic acid O-acetyltransferase [Capnocytophaga sp. H2931]CEN43361.1 Sugar O-acyltransferase, sialic acid O-acetyltransferase NeuD family [Capnocytophaga canis]CEN48709.1 Sugar O-acyltransferase, sialic acid O-acetyltransferase NeuD family [Capnocytophaga canis]CEN53792.1 Sugar O-acyltransferase, sialic acid O-acetyltransferase NeuD family [Capnocytophaga canis]